MVCDICILYAIALKVGCSMSNPVATVGLEKTFYTITENVDVVEVCVVVHSPSDIDCPITFPFDVHFLSRDVSAGKLFRMSYAL